MNKIVVILILLLALILRGWEFRQIPAGIYVDEAAHGVNAYSLLKTGKDEYGKPFPILMRSFGTYSSILYDYLTIVPVYFLGLNEISVRLISLISGLVLVGFVIWQFGKIMGLVVAIAPIFIFISRSALEPNLGLALLIVGSILAFKAFKNRKLLLLAFSILSLSSYGYHAERFLGIITIIFFSIKYWQKLKNLILLSLIPAIIIQIPILSVSLTSGAYARLSGLNTTGTIVERILSFIRLYLEYFSPNNLFSKPDPDLQRSFVDLSVFFWWMLISLIFGIFVFIKGKKWQDITGQYFLVLLFTSPILAALTKDYFSTFRVLPFFIAIAWLITLGLRILIKHKLIYLVLVLIALFELYPNLVLLKYEKSQIWNYEYKQLFKDLEKYSDKNIVIDNSDSKPVYILKAFYEKTDPNILQSRFNKEQINNYYSMTYFENNFRLENIEYRPINWKEDAYKDQILVGGLLTVSETQAKEHKLELLEEIPDINNEVILKIFKTNPKEKCKQANLIVPEISQQCPNYLY